MIYKLSLPIEAANHSCPQFVWNITPNTPSGIESFGVTAPSLIFLFAVGQIELCQSIISQFIVPS